MSSNDNVDIFICTHRDFNIYPNCDVYKIIHGAEEISVPLKQYTETPTDLSPMEYSLAEGSRIYWLYKNYDLKDYIGICHYRKYFSFWDKVPDIDELFTKTDATVITPIVGYTMPIHYRIFHRFTDFNDMCVVVKDLYPDIYEDFSKCISMKEWYPCDMFIMRSEDFVKYCDFAFGVIHEFCRRRGWKSDEDIKRFVNEHKGEYLKRYYPNNSVQYQSRVLGFLFERLTSCYIQMNFKKLNIERMILTENIY